MSKDELGSALKPFSKLLVGILFAGNIYFVKGLVDEMKSMQVAINELTVEVAVLKKGEKLCRSKQFSKQ